MAVIKTESGAVEALFRTIDDLYVIEARLQVGQPVNAWDVLFTNEASGRTWRIGGVWRESWKYHVSLLRATCKHQHDGSGLYHELGVYDDLESALFAAGKCCGRLRPGRMFRY